MRWTCHRGFVKWAAEETGGSTRFRVATKEGSLDKEDHLGDGCRWVPLLLSVEAIMAQVRLVLGIWAVGYVIFHCWSAVIVACFSVFEGRLFSGRG